MHYKHVLCLLFVSALLGCVSALPGCGNSSDPDRDSVAAGRDETIGQAPKPQKPDSSEPTPADPNSEKPNRDMTAPGVLEPDESRPDHNETEQPSLEQPKPERAVSSNSSPSPKSRNAESADERLASRAAATPRAESNATGAGSASRPIEITFDDLQLDIKEDIEFKEAMLTDRVRALEGKHVRIRGFLCAEATFKQSDIREFILIKNTSCKFGQGGEFHHNLAVTVKPADAIDFTTRPITVEGKLILKPMNGPDGKTWTIYHLQG